MKMKKEAKKSMHESVEGVPHEKLESKSYEAMEEMDSGVKDNRFLSQEGMKKESIATSKYMMDSPEEMMSQGHRKLDKPDVCAPDKSGPYPMVNESLRYK